MVRVVPWQKGGWYVDVRVRFPDGQRGRDRKVITDRSKSAAREWGLQRARHLLLYGPKKEVPTLEEFAPRYVEQHARANKLKPSSIAGINTVLRYHLLPTLGKLKLDAITGAQVQRLRLRLTDRSAKTTNNITGHLGSMLKRAVEWGELEKMPCIIKPLRAPKKEMRFYDFAEFERVVGAAKARSSEAHVALLLGGEAGCGWAKWSRCNGQTSTCTRDP